MKATALGSILAGLALAPSLMAQAEPGTFRLWARKPGQVLCIDASARVA